MFNDARGYVVFGNVVDANLNVSVGVSLFIYQVRGGPPTHAMWILTVPL